MGTLDWLDVTGTLAASRELADYTNVEFGSDVTYNDPDWRAAQERGYRGRHTSRRTRTWTHDGTLAGIIGAPVWAVLYYLTMGRYGRTLYRWEAP